MANILVTGSLGQIGSELIQLLREEHGKEHVIASDIRQADEGDDPFTTLDILDKQHFEEVIKEYDIEWIVHNASILSASGERNPYLAMQVNFRGFDNALEMAKMHHLRILTPSSIAAFGPSTPKHAMDLTIMRPTTIYGISKVYVELMGEYYQQKWGTDFRSLRYPGIISWKSPPGGGTTDYAVEIFYEALKEKHYSCFLGPDTVLPMMHMQDCLEATQKLLQVDGELLKQRTFNVAGISFSPSQLATEIMKHIPDFTIDYQPDYRQEIAESWPQSIDDTPAREQWGWNHTFDLSRLVEDMLENLAIKLNIQSPMAR